MKRILFLFISLILIEPIIQATVITPSSGDTRVPSRGKNNQITTKSRKEINREIGQSKQYIQKMTRRIQDLKNELDGASSIKGWSKEEIDAKTEEMRSHQRAIKDHLEKIADLKEELTTL